MKCTAGEGICFVPHDRLRGELRNAGSPLKIFALSVVRRYTEVLGCINKLLHLLTFTAFYGISSSIARIPITSAQNMPIDDRAL
jgi:hypothetical protein